MAAAVGVRADYTPADLRQFARRSGDADQVRRLLAIALILDGGSRSEAAKVENDDAIIMPRSGESSDSSIKLPILVLFGSFFPAVFHIH